MVDLNCVKVLKFAAAPDGVAIRCVKTTPHGVANGVANGLI